jgi:hypothetical protein
MLAARRQAVDGEALGGDAAFIEPEWIGVLRQMAAAI